MNYDERFTLSLIKIIKELQLVTQAELSRKSGVSKVTINSIVKRRRTASEDVKHKIASALGYNYDDFLKYGHGEKPNNVLPMHRYYDFDPRHRKAVDLIKSIFETKNDRLIEWVLYNLENFPFAIMPSPGKKRKTTGK